MILINEHKETIKFCSLITVICIFSSVMVGGIYLLVIYI